MDSKLRKMAVITSLALVLLVGLFVVWLNPKSTGKPGEQIKKTDSSEEDKYFIDRHNDHLLIVDSYFNIYSNV